jgi:hypothetical protein
MSFYSAISKEGGKEGDQVSAKSVLNWERKTVLTPRTRSSVHPMKGNGWVSFSERSREGR